MTNKPAPLDGRRKRLVARLTTERRHNHRVRLPLKGRFLTQDNGECLCEVLDISPGGLLVRSPALPDGNAHVVLMLTGLGRVEGDVVRVDKGGFAVRLHATGRKRDRLGDELTWLLNKDRLGLKDDRAARRSKRHDRVYVQTEDGLKFVARSVEVSLTGMTIETAEPIRPGEQIRIGRLEGVVVRRLARGFAVRFNPPDPGEEKPASVARPAPPPAAIHDDSALEYAPQKSAKAQ